MFDASLFRDATSTAVFYTFIAQLKQSIDSTSPTPTHRFLKTLDLKKKLLRSYTQNIDGLEARAGLLGSSSHEAKSTGKGKHKIRTKDVRNVQLHGDIHRVRCMSCSAEYSCTAAHLKMFNEGSPPDCPECLSRCTYHILILYLSEKLIPNPSSQSSSGPLGTTYPCWFPQACHCSIRRAPSARRRHWVYPVSRYRTQARYAYHYGYLPESSWAP